MDLTTWLLRHTPPRPLCVATPGGTATRLAVERLVRGRGWAQARHPAEANLLVVAGPVPDDLRPFLDRVWSQLPAPRARVHIEQPSEPHIAGALEDAVTAMRDPDRQRERAAESATPPEVRASGHGRQHGDGGDEHAENGHGDHGGNGPEADRHDNDHSEQHGEHGEHGGNGGHGGGHQHGGHDMGGMRMPGDVPMADRAPDRDGLTLDVLHVPLGPVLPDWPAGLVVRTQTQGDVITRASVEYVGLDGAPPGEPPRMGSPRARALDSCARLLSVAGWTDAATRARALRDDLLTTPSPGDGELARRLSAWARRVRRSRTLRWSLRGLGVTPPDPAVPQPLRGDALDRLYRWIDVAERGTDLPDAHAGTEADTRAEAEATRWSLDALPALLSGAELAAARLIVASLDPAPEWAARRAEAPRG